MPITDAEFDSLEVDGTEIPGEDPLEDSPEAAAENLQVEEKEPEAPAPTAPVTPQTRYGSKIKELKNAAETERQARAQAEQEAARLREQMAALPKVAPPAVSSGNFTFPTREQWLRIPGNDSRPWEDYDDERSDARYRWNDEKAQASRYAQSLDTRYDASLALVRTLYSDVDAVMAKNVEDTQLGRIPPLTVELRDAIKESEISGLVAYHLAGHPEDFAALNRLRGRELVRGIAKLEARLEGVVTGSSSAAPSRTPKAAPISPVGGGGHDVPPESPPVAEDEDTPDIELTAEWVRSENKREWERRGRR